MLVATSHTGRQRLRYPAWFPTAHRGASNVHGGGRGRHRRGQWRRSRQAATTFDGLLAWLTWVSVKFCTTVAA